MNIKKICGHVTLATMSALAVYPVSAQNIAIVNGTPIPISRADALIKVLTTRQGQQNTAQLQAAVRDELINREVLRQEAVRRGMLQRPEVKIQLSMAQQSVVIDALIEDFLKNNPPSDAEVRAHYDAAIKQSDSKQYRVRHILVDNAALAQQLIKKLNGGARFEAFAKQYSKDPGSAKKGGDLDWATPQTFVPEFSAALVQLKKGQITAAPVHTQFGWHILRLDDVREVKPPLFDAVKDAIAQQVRKEKLQRYQEELRQKAKIK